MTKLFLNFIYSSILLFAAVATTPALAQTNDEIPHVTIYTDEGDINKKDNIATQISNRVNQRLQDFLSKIGVQSTQEKLPWNRIIQTIPEMQDGIISEFIRTKSRENHFHWLLPMVPEVNNISLFAHKDLGLQNLSKEEILKKDLIAVCKENSAQCNLLLEFGFEPHNIIKVSNIKGPTLSNLILRKRADVTIEYNVTIQSHIEELQVSNELIIPILKITPPEVYIAGSINLDPRIVSMILENRDKFWDPIF